MIPADVRLISAKDLFVSQSALSGESLPVEKFVAAENSNSGNPLDHPGLCFMGTNVISGTGTGWSSAPACLRPSVRSPES